MLYFPIEVPLPVGEIFALARGGHITGLSWQTPVEGELGENKILLAAEKQIKQYFAGRRRVFDLPLKMEVTEHQRRACAAIADIPYGQTQSYSDIARRIGSGPRAVGQLCRRNPFPLLIPCHRVIGKNGYLGGYSGSRISTITIKNALLAHEANPRHLSAKLVK